MVTFSKYDLVILKDKNTRFYGRIGVIIDIIEKALIKDCKYLVHLYLDDKGNYREYLYPHESLTLLNPKYNKEYLADAKVVFEFDKRVLIKVGDEVKANDVNASYTKAVEWVEKYIENIHLRYSYDVLNKPSTEDKYLVVFSYEDLVYIQSCSTNRCYLMPINAVALVK